MNNLYLGFICQNIKKYNLNFKKQNMEGRKINFLKNNNFIEFIYLPFLFIEWTFDLWKNKL